MGKMWFGDGASPVAIQHWRRFIIPLIAALCLAGCPLAPLDTTPPAVTLNGPAEVVLECGESVYDDPGATAADDLDAAVEEFVVANTIELGNPGSYVITYGARDAAGNEAEPVTRQVDVVDTVAPLMPELPAEVVTVCGEVFVPSEGMAFDACAGEVPLTVAGVPKTGLPVGDHTIRYTATDPAGNEAFFDQLVRVVDGEAPVLERIPAEVTVECGGRYAPTGTAYDVCAGGLPLQVSGLPPADAGTGEYTVQYAAVDPAGNEALMTQRLIIADTTAPQIELTGEAHMTVRQGETYQDPGASAWDACEGPVVVNVSGDVDAGIIGEYIVTYEAIDSAGNQASVAREVSVVQACAGDGPWAAAWLVNEYRIGLEYAPSLYLEAVAPCEYLTFTRAYETQPALLRRWDGDGNLLREQVAPVQGAFFDEVYAMRDGGLLIRDGAMLWRVDPDGETVSETSLASAFDSHYIRASVEGENGSLWFAIYVPGQGGDDTRISVMEPWGLAKPVADLPGFMADALTPLRNGNILLAGRMRSPSSQSVGALYCIAPDGANVFHQEFSLDEPVPLWVFTTDSGALVASREDREVFAIALDAQGNTLWRYSYREDPYVDFSHAAANAEGELFFALYQYLTGTHHVIKVAADGTEAWRVELQEEANLQDLAPTSDGGVVLGFISTEGIDRGLHGVLLRLNADGERPDWPAPEDSAGWMNRYVWPSAPYIQGLATLENGYALQARKVNGRAPEVLLTDGEGIPQKVLSIGQAVDSAQVMAADGHGGLFLCGTRRQDSEETVYLLRANADGESLWERTWDSEWASAVVNMAVASPDGTVVVGTYRGAYPNTYYYLAAFDLQGALKWERQETDFYGETLLAGAKAGEIVVVLGKLLWTLDEMGQVIREKELAFPPRHLSVAATGDIVLAGDYFMTRLRSDGALVWERTGTSVPGAYALLASANGDTFVSGERFLDSPASGGIAHLDASGEIVGHYVPEGIYDARAPIIATSDGGIVFGGRSRPWEREESFPVLIKLTPEFETDFFYTDFVLE